MPSGQPLRQPRRLPPNVLDLSAPQYALAETQAKAPRQRRPAHTRRPALPAPRRLSASEERLTRWLYRHLHFRFGARALVRKYGARVILDAVHDGIMIWNERRVGTYDDDGQRIVKTVDERIINPAIISPPAFLCHMLKALDIG
jgi:hypothetical protein